METNIRMLTDEQAEKLTKALNAKEDDRMYKYILLKRRLRELKSERPQSKMTIDIVAKEIAKVERFIRELEEEGTELDKQARELSELREWR